MTLRARNDIHLARRLWHFGGVMVMALIDYALTARQTATVAVVASGVLVGCDGARLFSPRLNRLFTWVFRPVLRESERAKLAGSTAMMVGVTLTVLIFPRPVTLLTLLFFAVADPLASYCGILYGRDKLIGPKSFQGSAAAFAACFVIALVYLYAADLMRERLFLVAWLAGLIGAVSELIPVGKLDDNFVFPVMSASLLTGVFYVFGGLS